jgi:ferredoxin
MKVSVDTVRCVGSGQCSRTEPRVFDQDDEEGTVVLLLPSPPANLYPGVREAADICPVRAISIKEPAGGLDPGSSGSGDDVTSDSHAPSVREGTVP